MSLGSPVQGNIYNINKSITRVIPVKEKRKIGRGVVSECNTELREYKTQSTLGDAVLISLADPEAVVGIGVFSGTVPPESLLRPSCVPPAFLFAFSRIHLSWICPPSSRGMNLS